VLAEQGVESFRAGSIRFADAPRTVAGRAGMKPVEVQTSD